MAAHCITGEFKLRLITQVLAFIALLLGTAFAVAQEPMRLPVNSDKLEIVSNGKVLASFDIEIAMRAEEQAAGLMHRVDLPKDRGMLFVFDDEQERFFWMKNTPTPLDIVYADTYGEIVHVAANTTPFSTVPIPSLLPAKYAFEIHANLASELGVAVGDSLVHALIEKK